VRVAIGTSLAGAALAVAALLWIADGYSAAPLPVGALVESAQAPVAVQLEDGSRVALAPRAQLRLVKNGKHEVLLELRAGKASFAVAHDRSRPFKIDAGIAEVRVVGTRFELSRSREPNGEQLSVSVSEGVVEVQRTGQSDVQRLHAGERWGAFLPVAPPASAVGNTQQKTAETAADTETETAADTETETETETAADTETETETVAGTATETVAGGRARERAAARIFERANLARRAGQVRDAADAYAELLARFPRDRRAGLSAFELGRIRMDALQDPSGAIKALERAAAAGAAASFHEDALARMVVAYDAQGRTDACKQARARYLAQYPEGVHAHVLAARCR
jgi:tetratricopeptide (TPR) repeat protein